MLGSSEYLQLHVIRERGSTLGGGSRKNDLDLAEL